MGALKAACPEGLSGQSPRAGAFEKAGPGIQVQGSVRSRVAESVPGIKQSREGLEVGRT